MNKTFHHTALVLFFAFSFSFSQKPADFIVLDRPQKLTILNQYQQPLTESEKASFTTGTPLQVINTDEMLGDQITHAVQGAFGGKTWYLQKDEEGNLLGTKGKEGRQAFKNCSIASDTVEIVKDRSVRFSETPQGGAGAHFLNKGERVERIFGYRGQWYVKPFAHGSSFGWANFPPDGSWRRRTIAAVAADTGMTDFLQERIIERLTTANDEYRKYFTHFNSVTGKGKTVPQWQWERQGRGMHCFLNAPYRTGSQLDESTRYLVRDLENMLIGKQYEVLCDKGDITLKPGDRGAPGGAQ
jgi:hypothetical protein